MQLTIDLETMSFEEMVRLQGDLTSAIKRRFEKNLALVFTDVVGSTAYFARVGDQAGRGLQQRHLDLVRRVLPDAEGRLVDTTGDGAFAVFPDADRAAAALVRVQTLIAEQNHSYQPDHQLAVRAGLHWGRVLTDGRIVTGDAVNLCARMAATAEAHEIRLSLEAFLAASKSIRLQCVSLPAVELRGFPKPVSLVRLRWRDDSVWPTAVEVLETGERISLPSRDVISFGRLREHNGMPANDVVIEVADPKLAKKVSRWHFELHRRDSGYALRTVTDQLTEVDGEPVARGLEVPVRTGASISVAKVATLILVNEREDSVRSEAGQDDLTNFE